MSTVVAEPRGRLVVAGLSLAVVLLIVGCEEGPGQTNQNPTQPAPETGQQQQACLSHPADQIIGDWDSTHFTHDRDDEVYSFHEDGTFQHMWSTSSPEPGLDGDIITRTMTSSGDYSYMAATCTLTWHPKTANLDAFVAWNGPDQFCTMFKSRRSCIAAFSRRGSASKQ